MVQGGKKQVLHSSVIRVQLKSRCIFCRLYVPRQESWTAGWHLQREPSALTVPPSKYLTFLGPWCPTNTDCVIATGSQRSHSAVLLTLGGRKSDHNELQMTQPGKYFPLLLLLKKVLPAAAAAAALQPLGGCKFRM